MASRRLAGSLALVLVAGVAAGCSPRPDESAQAGKPAPGQMEETRTALSAFLAGRLAQGTGDSRAAADYYAAALKYDPDNLDLLQRAFTLAVAEGRMAAAAPMAERLLSFDSDAAVPLLVNGLKAARENRFEQAEAAFAALPKRGINSFLGPLMIAWARVGAGRTDAALETLATLSQSNGLDALRSFHAGLINDLADRHDAAEANYRVALAGQLSIRPVEAAGIFYQRTGKEGQARELYARYQAEHPQTMLFDGDRLLAGAPVRPVADARAGMAEALFDISTLMRQGNAADAALIFARLALDLDPGFALARMTVADILAAQERLDDANEMYRSIPADSPAHAYGRLRIAMNLDELGDTEGALKALDALAAERPADVDALVTKGDVLRRKKRFAEAATAYDAALARIGTPQRQHWPLLYSRAIAFERSKQWPKAEADFLKALELNPDQPDVLNYLGYSWVDMGLHLERARKMIEKAVELRPKDGAIVDSLGWALYRMGEYQAAVKHLERAVELKAEDPTVNDHLGDAYWQVGRSAEAMFQWRRAMSLDPEPEQIEPLKEKIRTGTLPAPPLAK
ncbi:tetratricopeptide repeat protein [Magnetospirillum sp. UT-4]|uniref:tetratricopeptide repeat protein n=1 Tax=Magnetospirillum sp. UT-4 TaxID=2681467 RepID=UPI0020C51863|nr:tetratricopeptide repeat protein [Magnetospirillum sp. UT-4]